MDDTSICFWWLQLDKSSSYRRCIIKSHFVTSSDVTLVLTLLGAVAPAGDPAAVAVGDGVGGRRQTGGLHQRPQPRRPRLLQLQQRDVVVERVGVVVLVQHDPLDVRHVFGTALRQHAQVGAPVARVGQPGTGQRSWD